MDTPTLQTPRLRLEPVALKHAPHLQPLFADPEVLRYLSAQIPQPYPAEGMQWFLEHDLLPRVDSGASVAWVLVLRETGTPVGLLVWRRHQSDEGDRGFWLGRPYWGQGLMTEAITAFQDHVFFEVGLERMELRSGIHNHGSSRLKEKTGCVKISEAEGKMREGSIVGVWEITRARWSALRRPAPSHEKQR